MKSWIIPEASPEFVCQMERVLSIYQRAYDPLHPVICLDESPKQLIKEVRHPFIDSYGVQHVDYEYSREGVTDLYMIIEPLGGRREVRVEDNHNRFTYARVVAHIAEYMYPEAEKITLVEDNLSAHKLSALYEIFPPERAQHIIQRLEVVRTPTHGSWLNIAECELSILTRQGISKRVADKHTLIEQVEAWYKMKNTKQTKVNWQFTTKDARIKLKHLYPSS
ncbi:IS630 family transposase [Plectonema cf. radiosum LEGE 06105]|uniref:IS630 family transposase n=1 Tax=Plectonema cf. radiosum LEGE 06105 TaxID=945769 RepID=A0A8J7F991_9CYAN|nr:IS630 family transposase [Plectonema radiosum]MBE9217218.1 IS630 family transposase [Plectonema cf. radiosum LEGE 06105]